MINKRNYLVAVATGLALLAAGPTQAISKKRAPQSKVATAKMSKCVSGPNYEDRLIEFEGRMQTRTKGERLQMRFRLQQRLPEQTKFAPIEIAGLGEWRTASADAKVMRYRQEVRSMEAPAEYRASVKFQWLDASGTVLRSTTRRTAVCNQKARLPDLVVDSITVSKLRGPGTATYYVVVSNRGKSEARNVFVELRQGGAAFGSETFPALRFRDTAIMLVNGPSCLTGVLEAVVDPNATIHESNDSNNTAQRPCG